MSDTKKANRILMATVAILLCLVLISTSVVSGVFAKFALQKTATTDKMKLLQFGASVTVNTAALDDFAKENGGSYPSNNNTDKDDIVITGRDFTIGPGDECKDAAYFTVGTGKPSVPAALKIKIELDYETDYFKIVDNANTTFKGIGDGETKYFLPIGFTFKPSATGATSEYIVGPWIVGSSADDISPAKVSEMIATALAGKFSSPAATSSGNVVTIPLTQGATPTLKFNNGTSVYTTNIFYVGFGWPASYTADTTYNYDIITTCLSDNFPDGTTDFFSYKVIVWIEQTAARPST